MNSDQIKKEKQRLAFEKYKREKEKRLSKKKPIKWIRLKKMIRPAMRAVLKFQRKICGFTIEYVNKELELTNKQHVFAVSHIGKWDFEIVNEALKPHFHILASDFMNMHGNFSGYAMNAFGVVFVDEQDKADRANTKKMMEAVLRQGDNIMIFPEAAWNFSENEMIYDIAFGAVDIAMATDSVIVPISLEQYGKRFVINIGKNYVPANKEGSTRELRDIMATLKYEIWEREGMTHRSDIPYDYWEKFLKERVSEWPGYDMHAQVTDTFIPKYKKEYFAVLKDMRKLKITEKNCFLVMDKKNFIHSLHSS